MSQSLGNLLNIYTYSQMLDSLFIDKGDDKHFKRMSLNRRVKGVFPTKLKSEKLAFCNNHSVLSIGR